MKINHDNYEQYFLDHAEGSLSPEMEKELADFLASNPDLRSVLADFDATPLPLQQIHNDVLKSRLKKNIHPTVHINEANAEEWLIGSMEGLLDKKEEEELSEFIRKNPAYAYDRDKFSQTVLEPDLTVTFNRKDRLKKKAPVVPAIRLAWLIPAAAAVILLFFGIRYFIEPVVVPTGTPSASGRTPSASGRTPSQIAGTPSLPTGTPSQVAGTPSLPTGTPSASGRTPSQIAGTPSASGRTPSQITGTPSRLASIRLEPAMAQPIVLNLYIVADLATYNLAPVKIEDKKEKPLFARVLGRMVINAKEGISRQAEMNGIDKSDFSLWTLARAGVEGYNSISDRDLELMVRKNEEGKVKSYALIEEDHLVWAKDLDKN